MGGGASLVRDNLLGSIAVGLFLPNLRPNYRYPYLPVGITGNQHVFHESHKQKNRASLNSKTPRLIAPNTYSSTGTKLTDHTQSAKPQASKKDLPIAFSSGQNRTATYGFDALNRTEVTLMLLGP